MTEDLHKSTQQLIRQIENKDRHFRTFQSISVIIIGTLVAILLVLNYNIQSQNRKLLDEQAFLTNQLKSSVADLKMNNDKKLSDLQHHIDCIVSLFTQPNRANLVINNITDCQFTSSGGQSSSSSQSQPSVAPTTQPSKKSQNNTPNEPQPTPQQPSFLQRNVVKPIMNVINGVKGLL